MVRCREVAGNKSHEPEEEKQEDNCQLPFLLISRFRTLVYPLLQFIVSLFDLVVVRVRPTPDPDTQ